MANTKIIELFVNEEEESGIEAISLVSKPAHEENWMAFNSEEVETLTPDYIIVNDDFCSQTPMLDDLGEPYSKLIKDGWSVARVEKITPQMVHSMNQQRFSAPNQNSELDTEDTRIRFKYVGPRDDKNRQFCAEMLAKNRVYRIEDIEKLTQERANEEFGYYSIFLYRGSFGCRHQWVRLIYKRDGSIRNSGTSTRGLEEEQGLGPQLQPNTVPKNQRDKIPPREGSSYTQKFGDLEDMLSKEKMTFSVIDEDKMILVGAAMVPNRMIHRYDTFGSLYYVYFSKESIKKMADRFLKQKRTDETSIEHNGIKLGSDKVYITESWVSDDPVYDKSYKYGFELPAGTWYVQMKVEDPKVWELIKTKTLNGFSVEGLFAEKSVFSKEDKQINQIMNILKSINDDE
jgi:hypothetical protein